MKQYNNNNKLPKWRYTWRHMRYCSQSVINQKAVTPVSLAAITYISCHAR